jgi:hypothetical protein
MTYIDDVDDESSSSSRGPRRFPFIPMVIQLDLVVVVVALLGT